MTRATRKRPERIKLGRLPIDIVDEAGALEEIAALVERGEGGLVFTPNVDHVVESEQNAAFAEAYASVSLSLIDGMAVLWACRMLGSTAAQKLSGSDLISPLMRLAATRGWRVFLLGGAPGVTERAGQLLPIEAPGLQIVGTSSPAIYMNHPREAREGVTRILRTARPDLVLLAFGSPKGELLAHELREAIPSVVFIGVGAGLDFLTGVVRRAPRWVSSIGLEWLFRLVKEPGRLWRRYLVRGPRFFPILIRALLARRGFGKR